MESIEPGSREEKNALSFLEVLCSEAGYEMRPPGYLTMQNISLLDLSFCKGKDAHKQLPPDQLRDEVNAYLFIQSAPGKMVARAIRAFRRALGAGTPREDAWETFMCEAVEPFLTELSLEKKTS